MSNRARRNDIKMFSVSQLDNLRIGFGCLSNVSGSLATKCHTLRWGQTSADKCRHAQTSADMHGADRGVILVSLLVSLSAFLNLKRKFALCELRTLDFASSLSPSISLSIIQSQSSATSSSSSLWRSSSPFGAIVIILMPVVRLTLYSLQASKLCDAFVRFICATCLCHTHPHTYTFS